MTESIYQMQKTTTTTVNTTVTSTSQSQFGEVHLHVVTGMAMADAPDVEIEDHNGRGSSKVMQVAVLSDSDDVTFEQQQQTQKMNDNVEICKSVPPSSSFQLQLQLKMSDDSTCKEKDKSESQSSFHLKQPKMNDNILDMEIDLVPQSFSKLQHQQQPIMNDNENKKEIDQSESELQPSFQQLQQQSLQYASIMENYRQYQELIQQQMKNYLEQSPSLQNIHVQMNNYLYPYNSNFPIKEGQNDSSQITNGDGWQPGHPFPNPCQYPIGIWFPYGVSNSQAAGFSTISTPVTITSESAANFSVQNDVQPHLSNINCNIPFWYMMMPPKLLIVLPCEVRSRSPGHSHYTVPPSFVRQLPMELENGLTLLFNQEDCYLNIQEGIFHFHKKLYSGITSLLKYWNFGIELGPIPEEAPWCRKKSFTSRDPTSSRHLDKPGSEEGEPFKIKKPSPSDVIDHNDATSACGGSQRFATASGTKLMIDPRVATLPTSNSKSEISKATFNFPGFDIVQILISPTNLLREFDGLFCAHHSFYFPASDAAHLFAVNSVETAVLRIILTAAGEYKEEIRSTMRLREVNVNDHTLTLPNYGRSGFNFDVSHCLKGSKGKTCRVVISAIVENWTEDLAIVFSLSIVRRQKVEELLNYLMSRPWILFSRTKEIVIHSLKESAENGILTIDSKITLPLKCPIGKTKIKTPCKGVRCNHFDCFDAYNFLKTYQNISYWKCPICDLHLDYDDLRIDGYFIAVLRSHIQLFGGDADVDQYQVKADARGEYSIECNRLQNEKTIQIVELSSSSEDDDEPDADNNAISETVFSESTSTKDDDADELSSVQISMKLNLKDKVNPSLKRKSNGDQGRGGKKPTKKIKKSQVKKKYIPNRFYKRVIIPEEPDANRSE